MLIGARFDGFRAFLGQKATFASGNVANFYARVFKEQEPSCSYQCAPTIAHGLKCIGWVEACIGCLRWLLERESKKKGGTMYDDTWRDLES